MQRICVLSAFAFFIAPIASAPMHTGSRTPFNPQQLDVRLESDEADAATFVGSKPQHANVPPMELGKILNRFQCKSGLGVRRLRSPRPTM
jgi:hypothetical protein